MPTTSHAIAPAVMPVTIVTRAVLAATAAAVIRVIHSETSNGASKTLHPGYLPGFVVLVCRVTSTELEVPPERLIAGIGPCRELVACVTCYARVASPEEGEFGWHDTLASSGDETDE